MENKDILLEPHAGERVCFPEFIPRGFSLPMQDFVCELLYAYGIQIHVFTPKNILHIAYFMVLCECFLGVSLVGHCGSISSRCAITTKEDVVPYRPICGLGAEQLTLLQFEGCRLCTRLAKQVVLRQHRPRGAPSLGSLCRRRRHEATPSRLRRRKKSRPFCRKLANCSGLSLVSN